MPAVLPVALLVTVLGACGDEKADDPAGGDPTVAVSSPSGGQLDAVDFELVDTITETAAGGATSEFAVPLGDDAAVQAFTSQFETDALPARVQDAVAATDVPDGMLLYGAVVAIGCDAPTEVSVVVDDAGVVVTAHKVPSPMVECFAAMTTVALVLVPASAVS